MKQISLLKKHDVLSRCAISNSTLYRLIKSKQFPCPVSITGVRAVGWRSDEIDRWINDRKATCV
jgi:prophage regulatory protein